MAWVWGGNTPCLKNDIVVKNIGFLESILHLGKKSENEKLKKKLWKKSLEKAVIFDYIDYADLPSPDQFLRRLLKEPTCVAGGRYFQ